MTEEQRIDALEKTLRRNASQVALNMDFMGLSVVFDE